MKLTQTTLDIHAQCKPNSCVPNVNCIPLACVGACIGHHRLALGIIHSRGALLACVGGGGGGSHWVHKAFQIPTCWYRNASSFALQWNIAFIYHTQEITLLTNVYPLGISTIYKWVLVSDGAVLGKPSKIASTSQMTKSCLPLTDAWI